MAGFDVLHRNLSLDHHYFLEASAGTGKTFAIEHLFLRLLIEKEDISLDKILVVTFTKAATQELKRRIRTTLEKALLALEGAELPDFLQSIVDKGEKALFLTKKKIRRALSLFDEVKIFTIHGFCYSTLTEELEEKTEEKREQTIHYLRDFLRTELQSLCTPSQLDKLLRNYRNEIEKLISALLTLLLRKAPIHCDVDMQEVKNSLAPWIHLGKMAPFPEFLEDLSTFAALHKGMCGRDGSLKEEVLEELQLLETFDLQDPFSYPFLAQMTPDKRLVRKKEPSFHYPELIKKMERELIPQLNHGLDCERLLAYVAEKARLHVEKALTAENILVTEDILLLMEQKIEDPSFVASIQKNFKAVLIDEFQDTDRVQWKIFKKLFVDAPHFLPVFLIGDPKQSIYRFRGGDIYTYFQAKKEFVHIRDKTFHGELSCNFRSDPQLVEALNCLFSLLSPFQIFPQNGEALHYSPVYPDPKKKDFDWKDGKKALHFFEAEREEEIFTAMAQEIHYLHREYQFSYRECAVLVNDRYQAERFQKWAKNQGLHAVFKRSRPLTESPAYAALIELIEGVLFYKKEGFLLKTLGGVIFSYSYHELEEEKQKWITPFSKLKEKLDQEGILPFFRELMEGYALYEKLFARPLGGELYFDLLQLCEILTKEKRQGGEHYLTLLKNLSCLHSEDESIQAHGFSLEEAVPILTIHGSKGLEFDIVLALGLITPLQQKKGLVFDPETRGFYLNDELKKKEEAELTAERMRLFYVAATRAKKRLYLPLLSKDTESILGIFSEKTLLKEKWDKLPFSHSFAEKTRENFYPPVESSPKELSSPAPLSLYFDPLPITSFSRLASPNSLEKKTLPEATHHLPLGADTGVLLHTILEKTPWIKFISATSPLELIPSILPWIERTPYDSFVEVIATHIFAAFQAPLPTTPSFCLKEIEPSKIFREMEFFYFSETEQSYLKGFVDLLFEFDRKLYLVDWKTNYLENYDLPSLEREMHSHDYFLQKQIYQEALQKYGALFENYELGGCLYIFLRAPNLGKGDGIFFS